MKKVLFFMFVMAVCLVSCKQKPTINHPSVDYSDTSYWYACGDESHQTDVFYVYPTVSTISFLDNGSSWFADITLPEVREEANGNQRFNKMLMILFRILSLSLTSSASSISCF